MLDLRDTDGKLLGGVVKAGELPPAFIGSGSLVTGRGTGDTDIIANSEV